MSWRTCVVVKQIQSNPKPLSYPHPLVNQTTRTPLSYPHPLVNQTTRTPSSHQHPLWTKLRRPKRHISIHWWNKLKGCHRHISTHCEPNHDSTHRWIYHRIRTILAIASGTSCIPIIESPPSFCTASNTPFVPQNHHLPRALHHTLYSQHRNSTFLGRCIRHCIPTKELSASLGTASDILHSHDHRIPTSLAASDTLYSYHRIPTFPGHCIRHTVFLPQNSHLPWALHQTHCIPSTEFPHSPGTASDTLYSFHRIPTFPGHCIRQTVFLPQNSHLPRALHQTHCIPTTEFPPSLGTSSDTLYSFHRIPTFPGHCIRHTAFLPQNSHIPRALHQTNCIPITEFPPSPGTAPDTLYTYRRIPTFLGHCIRQMYSYLRISTFPGHCIRHTVFLTRNSHLPRALHQTHCILTSEFPPSPGTASDTLYS